MVAQGLHMAFFHAPNPMHHVPPGRILKEHHVATLQGASQRNDGHQVPVPADEGTHAVPIQGDTHGQHRSAPCQCVPLGDGDAPCLFLEGMFRSRLGFTCTLNRGQNFSSSAHPSVGKTGESAKSEEPFQRMELGELGFAYSFALRLSGCTFAQTCLGNHGSICLIVLRTAEPRRVFCWMICNFITIVLQIVTSAAAGTRMYSNLPYYHYTQKKKHVKYLEAFLQQSASDF